MTRESDPRGTSWTDTTEPGRDGPRLVHPDRLTVLHSQGTTLGDGATVSNTFNNYSPAVAGPSEVKWPVRVGRPPHAAESFQPRTGLRHQVDAVLDAASGVAAGCVVLTGDGGRGKTQLAVVTYRERCTAGLDFALRVSATSRDNIVSHYARSGAELGLGAGRNADDQAEAFLEWLSSATRPWLIVLDDVADPDDLRGLWPEGASGQVLVTTRRRDDAMTAGMARVAIEVGAYTPQEATGYLTQRLDAVAGAPADVLDQVGELAADLGYLPVAVGQAAAVIADEAISCTEFRHRLTDRSRTLADLFPAEIAGRYQRGALAATWSLALQRADTLSPVGMASRLAVLVAVLDPNSVPELVLASEAARSFIAAGQPGDDPTRAAPVSPGQIHRTIRSLHYLSVVSHDAQAGLSMVRMHALAQRAVLESSTPHLVREATRAAADALVEAWPEVDTRTVLGQVLRSNTDALISHDDTSLWGSSAHRVLFRAGRSIGEAGQVTRAVTHWQRLHSTAVQHLGPDHPDTLAARQQLARGRGEAGEPAGAATALEALLTDMQWVLGPDHPETLTTRANLARWRGEAGDRTGGATAFEALLTDRLRVLGPDHPDTLDTRHNLARWRGLAGDPTSAATALEALLPDVLRVLGPDHPATLTTRHILAHWRGQAGDPTSAATALEALLPDVLRVLGPDHPDTLDTRHSLAHWRGRTKPE
jgi:hypothetical protein